MELLNTTLHLEDQCDLTPKALHHLRSIQGALGDADPKGVELDVSDPRLRGLNKAALEQARAACAHRT